MAGFPEPRVNNKATLKPSAVLQDYKWEGRYKIVSNNIKHINDAATIMF